MSDQGVDMPEPVFDPQLLDWHLGQLDADEEVQLRSRLTVEPQLANQHARLAAVFAALRTQHAVTAPADLVDRTLRRVAACGLPLRTRPADVLTRLVEQQSTPVLRQGSLREILAAAAMIVLMVSVAVPSLLHLRERGQRMGCSANLAALGVGLQQYAQTFNASLPFVGWSPRASWAPSNDPGVEVVPNRRHVYPLLRAAFVTAPRLFICPGRGGVPMPADQVSQRADFIDSSNVSYGYYNMAGVRPSLADSPELPILGDENPLFEDGFPLFDRLGLTRRERLNSRAHAGAGQNILTLDGHVKWTTTPSAGIDGDNIWTLQHVDEYRGTEGPTRSSDSHLIK